MNNLEKAKDLFDTVVNLDGAGIVVTDSDLLAEEIANMYEVVPEDICEDYGE